MNKFCLLMFFKLFVLCANLIAQEKYVGYAYTFSIPIGWATNDDPTGRVDVLLKPSNTTNTPNITVTTKGVVKEPNLYGIRASIIDPIKQAYGNVEVVREEKVSIIENPSDLLFELIIHLPDGRKATIIQYVFVLDGINYVVSGLELRANTKDLEYAMEHVIQSFGTK